MEMFLAGILAFVISTMSLFAQGSLTPPAAPAPTMKTLTQVEPRILIDPAQPGFTTPYTITQSGSYYLAGNITVSDGTSAIVINSHDVTLDLNGFALISTSSPAAGEAVLINHPSGSSSSQNVTVRNGSIRGQVTLSGTTYNGAGFADGIHNSAVPQNLRAIDVRVSGCKGDGIFLESAGLGASSTIERCSVDTVAGVGASAGVVTSTTVTDAGGGGIFASVCAQSYGATVGGNNGITATTTKNSTGVSSGGAGISGGGKATAADSSGNGVSGIVVETVSNCAGNGTTGPGIHAQVATNSEGISNSGIGLQVDLLATNCRGVSSSNTGLDAAVTANSCFGSTGNFSAIGLKVTGTANVSGGQNTAGGVAIQATVGIGCGLYGGSSNIPSAGKFLGTP